MHLRKKTFCCIQIDDIIGNINLSNNIQCNSKINMNRGNFHGLIAETINL